MDKRIRIAIVAIATALFVGGVAVGAAEASDSGWNGTLAPFSASVK